jgi:exopolysaccharide biosynthesis polyprenyl glycosylphosphotransferase
MPTSFKQILLLIGDVVLLYSSLLIALLIRGRIPLYEEFLIHLEPFTILFVLWLVVFYIIGLYDLARLKNNFEFLKSLSMGFLVSGIMGISFFYLTPLVGLTPKTTLLIFLLVFVVLAYYWRYLYNLFISSGTPTSKLLVIGNNAITKELVEALTHNPQLGYEVSFWMREGLDDKEFNHLSQIILGKEITAIVIPGHIKKNTAAARTIYKNLALGIEVLDLAELYEAIFRKVPLEELEEVWFLENLSKRHQLYETLKQPIERTCALALCALFSPLMIALALVIKLTSRGPAIYTQERAGKNGKLFTMYKFRTMRTHQSGPLWTTEKDARITLVGKILRYTHLDEFPQLLNIAKGDISFIGPRPERKELAEYYSQLPYYEIRHIIKPGLTGWAQLNYRPSASLEEASEKLKYDVYYVKNRSLILDFFIILKTIKYLFISNGS